MIDLSWMQWTPLTIGAFFTLVGTLTVMTIWDVKKPSEARKGFLPIAFTRGERLFLSIITFFSVLFLFMAFLPDVNPLLAIPTAAVIILILVFFG